MSTGSQPLDAERRADFLARAEDLRPELHRYCARLMGSVIEGEDVVQDTLARAVVALQESGEPAALRAWLFRIAHNRAMDVLRGRAFRDSEPIEAASAIADPNPEPMETLMQREAIKTAVSRFTELPTVQRSIVILKDVLDEPLADIARLLDVSVDSVKAHLARGRARLREINARIPSPTADRTHSNDVSRYVTLFNQHDWDGLRALLADDVKLQQSSHAVRSGSKDVGGFFGKYAKIDGIRLAPAWLEGREVIAVFEHKDTPSPAYFMWLKWRDGRIVFIRDYRYDRYVMRDAELKI
ncbi:DNA-directed RNA polymerase sigma-70 factor [Steroidobacter agaridevorans]|uniref:DNA-directed RNA polymerase sigma-70 factor n=1 Tax=Steroidobacter agaridevorans TaxID=2695856 RepID=A0A829YLN4_9GAMM|nr:sigma-70 family RNA polymerase sigma factor [Steroidobacter agaridevorans]GFE84160.1 DNA-directed RNA polymerase sigma-70 factor [Steroidobacter agaridevorans]